MKVKFSYLDQQFADVEVEDYFSDLRELVRTGEFTLGPFVEKFEKKFANYLGVKHVIGTNTGTGALTLSLKALGIGPGDEVITVANTFYATAGAIVAAGARPVFVDCDERYSIDVTKIEAAITSKTKALLPVHWGGVPAEIEEVCQIAKKHGLKVVEDACQGAGSAVNGKKCGTFGDIAGFSMHPLKPLNVWGDGGMIATNNDSYAKFLRLYQNHGLVDRDHISMWGINERLQPFQAIVATRVLDTVEDSIERKIAVARRLDEGLKKLSPLVTVPPRLAGYKCAFLLYLVTSNKRDALYNYLRENGIDAKIHYPIPLHLQEPCRKLGYKEGDFPVAEQQAKELITLPAHQFVTDKQIDYMLEIINNFRA